MKKNNVLRMSLHSASLIFLSLPAFAAVQGGSGGDDTLTVTGIRCPYGAICVTGDDMYWYMTRNYGGYPAYPNYQYGGALSDAEKKKKAEEEKAKCRATAGGTAYSCKNAYANLTTICNAYTGALGGWAIKLMSEAKGAAAATAAAAGGYASTELVTAVFDVTMPCDKLKEVYEPFCANLGKTLLQKCN